MPEVDREFKKSYLVEDGGDILKDEYPYKLLVRGDFESKHFGTITWKALMKFKKHLITKVLSWNGRKLPEPLWTIALNNYIDNNIDICEKEKRRWNYHTRWYFDEIYSLENSHDFFDREESIKNSAYKWRYNRASNGHVCYVRAAGRVFNIINNDYQYVGNNKDYPIIGNLFPTSTIIDDEDIIDDANVYFDDYPMYYHDQTEYMISLIGDHIKTVNNNWTNPELGVNPEYVYARIGEAGEFNLYMPEYDNYGESTESTTIIIIDDVPTVVYDYNAFTSEYSKTGLLDDLIHHLTNLRDLKYDYSNIDETLTKDWLYLKTSQPCMEAYPDDYSLEPFEEVSSFPYYNEAYVRGELVSSYMLFSLDKPPCIEPPIYSNPDLITRDKVAYPAYSPLLNEKDDDIKIYGYDEHRAYNFQWYELIYRPTGPKWVHDPADPHCIAGNEVTLSDKPGQPNEPGNPPPGHIYKLTPTKVRFECVKGIPTGWTWNKTLENWWEHPSPTKYEKVWMIDSTTFASESEIDERRELCLPILFDNRLYFYKSEDGAIYYNSEITKEFPWMNT